MQLCSQRCASCCMHLLDKTKCAQHTWMDYAIFLHRVLKRKESVEVLSVPSLFFLIVGIRELKFWDNHGQ